MDRDERSTAPLAADKLAVPAPPPSQPASSFSDGTGAMALPLPLPPLLPPGDGGGSVPVASSPEDLNISIRAPVSIDALEADLLGSSPDGPSHNAEPRADLEPVTVKVTEGDESITRCICDVDEDDEFMMCDHPIGRRVCSLSPSFFCGLCVKAGVLRTSFRPSLTRFIWFGAFCASSCCDSCAAWQHVECLQLDNGNLPDTYFCERCHPRFVF